MFDALSDKLQGIFRSIRGQGTLSEAQVDGALREIRLALLEADVHFKVVKDFVEGVRAKAVGEEVRKSLSPDQAVLRIVRDEMVALLGGEEPARLQLGNQIPSVVLMTGLQGSGKTTTSAKLGRFLKEQGKHPLLVSTDVYRPAAREQLKTVGEKAGLKVHHPEGQVPRELLRSALAEARAIGHDVLIVDTAGRLHIDDELMAELQELKALAEPREILYVADAMTGQDAVKSAAAFHQKIGVTGIVLTKLDGDARGGAALSAAAVTGCPVKFAGLGEKVEAFEPFAPGRLVGRILGLGDVLSLLERVEGAVDRDQAEEMVRKLRRSEFTLEDYRDQLRQMRRLGKLEEVIAMIPGVGSAIKGANLDEGEREMKRAGAIIDSMTPGERCFPTVINGSRRKRIALGSGTRVEDVNRLLRSFAEMRKAMKQMMGAGGGMKAMKRFAARMPQFGR